MAREQERKQKQIYETTVLLASTLNMQTIVSGKHKQTYQLSICFSCVLRGQPVFTINASWCPALPPPHGVSTIKANWDPDPMESSLSASSHISF